MLVGWAQAGRRQRSFWNVVRAQGASPGEGRGEGCAGMSHRQHAVAAGRDRPLPSVHFCVWRLHPGRVQSTCHTQAHVRPGRHSLTAVSPSALGQHFDTDTQDLAGIEWAPNGCVLAAWDTCLEVWVSLALSEGGSAVGNPTPLLPEPHHLAHLVKPQSQQTSRGACPTDPACPYSSRVGPRLTMAASRPQYKVLLYSLDGRLLAAYCAYEWSLGVKAVAWSPSSQFLAVGSYDGKVGKGARSPTVNPEDGCGSVTPSSRSHCAPPSGAHSQSRDLEGAHGTWAPRSHQRLQSSKSRRPFLSEEPLGGRGGQHIPT